MKYFFSFKHATILVTIALLLCFFTLNKISYNNSKPELFIDMQTDSYRLNKTSFESLSLGQSRMISALLWVDTLIKLDNKHYKKKDLNSWPYLRFDLIATLEPRFYANYLFGAQYLSVIKDDLVGAKELYLRGLKIYPNDYFLNFAAGYHFYFELNDPDQSVSFFKEALKSPKAPTYLPSLIARLETERNNPQVAFTLLLNIYKESPLNSNIRKYYHRRLYDIKAHIDLSCLNAQKKGCKQLDFDGNYYVKKGEKYFSRKKILPLMIFKKTSSQE